MTSLLRRARSPLTQRWLVILWLAGTYAYFNRSGIQDLDSWWHVRIGDQIRNHVPFAQLGDSWSLYLDHQWRTSQWLTEVIFSQLHSLFGWHGILLWKNLLGVALFSSLALTALKGRAFWQVAPILFLVTFVLAPLVQERPALAALFLTLYLGRTQSRMLSQEVTFRRLLWWVPLTILWANLHGSWVLVPTTFAVTTIAIFINQTLAHTGNTILLRTRFLLITMTGLAGCLTPIGWHGLLLPFTVAGRASHFIVEWQRTSIIDMLTIPFALLALIGIWALIRSERKCDGGRIFLIYFWSGFALLAFRNIGPALLMLLPLCLDHLLPAQQNASPATLNNRPAIFGAGLVFILLGSVLINPLTHVTNREIGAYLKSDGREFRLFNAYNSSGPLLAFSGERIKLMIDGRADRYPTLWIDSYFEAINHGRGISYYVDRYNLNGAVILNHSSAFSYLKNSMHWNDVVHDGEYALLLKR